MTDTYKGLVGVASLYTNQWGLSGLYVPEYDSKTYQEADKAYTQGYNGLSGQDALNAYLTDHVKNSIISMIPYSGLGQNLNNAVATGDWTGFQKAAGDNAFWTVAAVVGDAALRGGRREWRENRECAGRGRGKTWTVGNRRG